jgi:hypothetical protein
LKSWNRFSRDPTWIFEPLNFVICFWHLNESCRSRRDFQSRPTPSLFIHRSSRNLARTILDTMKKFIDCG